MTRDKWDWEHTDRSGIFCGVCDEYLGVYAEGWQQHGSGELGIGIWPIRSDLVVLGFRGTGNLIKDQDGLVIHECGTPPNPPGTGYNARIKSLSNGRLVGRQTDPDGTHHKVSVHLPSPPADDQENE